MNNNININSNINSNSNDTTAVTIPTSWDHHLPRKLSQAYLPRDTWIEDEGGRKFGHFLGPKTFCMIFARFAGHDGIYVYMYNTFIHVLITNKYYIIYVYYVVYYVGVCI